MYVCMYIYIYMHVYIYIYIYVYIYIYQNKLDKACFQHDMVNEYFKDLPRTTASDKVLRHKVFNIARNPKYDRYQRGLSEMVYKFLDKKSSGGAII